MSTRLFWKFLYLFVLRRELPSPWCEYRCPRKVESGGWKEPRRAVLLSKARASCPRLFLLCTPNVDKPFPNPSPLLTTILSPTMRLISFSLLALSLFASSSLAQDETGSPTTTAETSSPTSSVSGPTFVTPQGGFGGDVCIHPCQTKERTRTKG